MTIKLSAQNGSGETGTATLTNMAEGVQVVVALSGAPSGVPQPTHIHFGTCAKLNPAPKYPLANTIDGKGSTVVKGVTIADLMKTPMAVNVHKSTSDLKTYVACGDITKSNMADASKM
jgi:hypothetical protein